MEIGKEVFVKRDKMYGERQYRYQKGKVYAIYAHYILVEFRYDNGNSYKESFFEYELINGEEDLGKNACIY